MSVTLEQALANLSSTVGSGIQVGSLAELVDGDLPLQSFLEQLLPLLCDLYAAPAAVAWLKTQGAIFGVRYRMESLLPTVAHQRQHERLVQLSWQQNRPLLAEPAGLPKSEPSDLIQANSDVPNPTNHRLLFAPIVHSGEPIAVLEIALPMQAGMHAGTQQSIDLSAAQKQLYLRSIQLVAQRVYGGLKRRMAMPSTGLAQVTRELTGLSAQIQSLHIQIQRAIENRLAQFQGLSFATLADNQEFARLVHQLLDSHGLRVVCPECGHPAILRCLRAGNAKNGVFVFDHYLDSGRTFHGGPTTVPVLKVTAKPARRNASTSGTAAQP